MPITTAGSIRIHACNPDTVRRMYANGMSQGDIAAHFGTTRATVYRLMRKHDIRARSNAESQTVVNVRRSLVLTEDQEQLILGSLLGDACLHRSQSVSNKTGARISCLKLHFAHTAKHLPYLLAKHQMLGVGTKTRRPTAIYNRTSGHGSDMRCFTFSHTPTLQRFASMCLDAAGKKRVSAAWVDRLTLAGVAWWYQDDGAIYVSGEKRRSVTLCTDSFTRHELNLLRGRLHALLGCAPRVAEHARSVSGVPQFRLAYYGDDANRFVFAVYPHIHPCMLYKTRFTGAIQ